MKADGGLETIQAALLTRLAPGTRVRRVRWSQGETQVLESGDGPPLLLVHGVFSEALAWAPIFEPLGRDRRVFAVDLPGHGLADAFDYSRADLLRLARTFLGEILDALELRSVDIAAHSAGGLCSVAFALQEPRRVTRLALVGAPAGIGRPGVPFQLRLLCLPHVGRSLARRLMSDPTRAATRKLWGQSWWRTRSVSTRRCWTPTAPASAATCPATSPCCAASATREACGATSSWARGGGR